MQTEAIGIEEDEGVARSREHYVICVDDDTEFLRSVELFLPEEVNRAETGTIWYRFLFFSEPVDALRSIRELVEADATIAMVICDQKMPHMKGTQLLAEAKVLCPESIRVLLTGHAGMESAIVAINEHLLDKYLTKPIENEHDFLLNILHLLQRYRMTQTIAEQNRALQALYEFSNRLNAIEDFEETLGYLAGFTQEAVECSRVALYLVDNGALRIAAAPGFSADEVDALSDPATAGSLLDFVLTRDEQAADGKELHTAIGPVPSVRTRNGTSIEGLMARLTTSEEPIGLILVMETSEDASFGPTESEILTYIANTASIAIHNQMNHLEMQKLWSEAKRQALALSEAKSRLEVLDRMKTDFLSFISHELRTPLNHISAVGLLEDCSNPKERALMVEAIRSGYEHLESFVFRGLEYFEWMGKGASRTAEVMDLAKVVGEVVSRLPALKGPGIDLQVMASPEPCPVRFEARGLRQVLQILLENAVKFSPNEQWIRVETAHRGETVLLTVSDHGVGFPSALGDGIFRPFTIGNIRTHGQGSALNLAKASAIVEAFGGKMHAESPGEAQGATFLVELPLVRQETGDSETPMALAA